MFFLFVCLTAFTQHNYLEIHLCHVNQNFIPFYSSVVFHCMIYNLFMGSSIDKQFVWWFKLFDTTPFKKWSLIFFFFPLRARLFNSFLMIKINRKWCYETFETRSCKDFRLPCSLLGHLLWEKSVVMICGNSSSPKEKLM